MVAKARKARSDSLEHHLKLVDKHGDKVVSPLPLEGAEPVIFEELIGALPSSMWDAPRIRLAAQLARYMAYLDTLMVELKSVDPVIEGERGPRTNPKLTATREVASMVQQLTRTLGLSASQRGVTEGSRRQQAAAQSKVDRGQKAADNNALIA